MFIKDMFDNKVDSSILITSLIQAFELKVHTNYPNNYIATDIADLIDILKTNFNIDNRKANSYRDELFSIYLNDNIDENEHRIIINDLLDIINKNEQIVDINNIENYKRLLLDIINIRNNNQDFTDEIIDSLVEKYKNLETENIRKEQDNTRYESLKDIIEEIIEYYI